MRTSTIEKYRLIFGGRFREVRAGDIRIHWSESGFVLDTEYDWIGLTKKLAYGYTPAAHDDYIVVSRDGLCLDGHHRVHVLSHDDELIQIYEFAAPYWRVNMRMMRDELHGYIKTFLRKYLDM